MSSFPTMKMNGRFTGDVDDMYNIHGHAGNLCRKAILEGLGRVINSRSEHPTIQPISIADFGTADGRASLSLFNEMIGNTHDPGLNVTGNVYPVIVPRTMFEQCLPDNSIDLAISTVATHYLSKEVCQIKDGICFEEADDEEQKLMREQGKADWRNFVISRGRELKPGGFLITLSVSSNDEGELSSVFESGLFPLGSIVSDMAREGIITQEEQLATNWNAYIERTAKDFKEPFTCPLPEIEELGLELLSIKSVKQYHPTFDIINKDTTDKLKYSQRIVAMVYPWLHHVIYRGLSDSRSEEEKELIIDQYFRRIQTYAFEHSDFKPYIIFTEVVIKKNM